MSNNICLGLVLEFNLYMEHKLRMSNTIKKKTIIPLSQGITCMYSTRSNLQSSYSRPQSIVIPIDFVVAVNGDGGGIDEDPLPTNRSVDRISLGKKYNGTLYRSTTTRPLLYEASLCRESHGSALRGTPVETENAQSRLNLKIRAVAGLIKKYFLIKVRDLHRLSNLLYFPTIDILVGGLIWLWREQASPGLANLCTEYIFELTFWIIINSIALETCFNFLEEFQSRNLVNLFASPIKHTDWLMATAIMSVFESLMTILICGSIAYFAFGVSLVNLGVALPFFLIVCVAFGWTLAIFTSGMLLKYGQRATFFIYALPYMILPLCAPFYGLEAMPRVSQYVAYCLPATYIFEGLRHVIYGGHMPVANICISLILTIGYMVAALMFFNYMFKKSKEMGLARLEQE